MAALHTAVKRGDLQSVKELLRTNKSLANERDEQKRCVLHIAASSSACGPELLDFLLAKSKKLDVNTQDLSGWTPLHCATSKGLYATILHLLGLKNLKASLPNEERNTPFHNLCKLTLDTSAGSDDVFQFSRCLSAFAARSIDLNEQNKAGDSALHCATRCGNVEAVDFLCRRGALINVLNKNGETPLSLAVMGRRPENVRTLLEFGARLEFGGHTYASLDQAAALPVTKQLLNEIFTVQYVIEQKMKELDGMKRELRRDRNMTEELERTMRKEKKSSAPSRIPLRSGVGTLRSKPSPKSLTQSLQMCERFDNRFYIARSGVWTCCAKRIEFANVPLANKRATQMQFLGDVQHPHILPVLSVSNEQTHVRVFTEWAPSNLRKLLVQMRSRLDGKPYLAVSEIVRMARQIAEPLEYLHAHKIVCRCVKVDQVFVGQKSADKHAQMPSLLLPLYYASRAEDPWPVPEAGNADYYEPSFALATETRFNALSYPFSADVWAFGTVLYELLIGKPPYGKVATEKVSEYMKMQSPVVPQVLRGRRQPSRLAASMGGQSADERSSSSDGAAPAETYKLIVGLIEACTELDAMKRPTMSEVVYALVNYRHIGEVMRNKLHKQPIKDELPKTALPHQGEWPADPNRLPFHVLPHMTSSPLLQGGAGYVVEAPLESKSSNTNPVVLQFEDNCVPYYKNLISPKLHDNFMGVLSSSPDDPDRFAVISVSSEPTLSSTQSGHEYRAIVRTISGDDRIVVACDGPKERIKALKQHPLVAPYKLTLIKEPSVTRQLIDFEASQMEARAFKFGVVYRRKGQSTDNEMYSNRKGSPAFQDFLRFLGSFVLLKGWDGFRGGLDVVADTTGTQSVFATTGREQIMFHVSTLLPFDEDNPQQLHRKRHIGNDIVVIIFQDADAGPFSPAQWASNFNHVFLVIQEVPSQAGEKGSRGSLTRSTPGFNPSELALDLEPMDVMAEVTPTTRYQISVAYKDSIAIHPRPFLREPCTFVADSDFHHFLLTKLINCERVAMRSKNFAGKMKAVRRQYLSDIVDTRKTKKH